MMNPLFSPIPVPHAAPTETRMWKLLGSVAYDPDGSREAIAMYMLERYDGDLNKADEEDLLVAARSTFQWLATTEEWQGRKLAIMRPSFLATLQFQQVDPRIAEVVSIN